MSQSRNRNKLSMKVARNNKDGKIDCVAKNYKPSVSATFKSFFSISSAKLNEDEDDSFLEMETKGGGKLESDTQEDNLSRDNLVNPHSTSNELNDSIDVFSFKKDLVNNKNQIDSTSSIKSSCSTNAFNLDLDTKDDDDEQVPIPDIKKSIPAEKSVVIAQSNENLQQCPICLKFVTKHLSHVKSCAAKNKLSTQQVLSALKLQKKQMAERMELGLGLPVQSFRARTSPKRRTANNKAAAGDSTLQLALALSASLRSALESEVIQEAEALQQAGLSEEAEQRLGTLETFGFETAMQPVKTTQGGSKARAPLPTLLLKRSKEERERIITEKVAIVLISDDDSCGLVDYVERQPDIKSKLLNREWNKETQLWSKSHCPEDTERRSFYVDQLAGVISPSRAETGAALRRLSQVPGRLNTPVKDDIENLPTPQKSRESSTTVMLSTPITTSPSSSDIVKFSEAPTRHKSALKSAETNKLSEDWRSLVGSSLMSDVTVLCKGDDTVCAHKLVFHVRCPLVLNCVSQQYGQDVLKWEDHSRTSVLAFLEYVYSGKLDAIRKLDCDGFCSVQKLADRFEYSELKSHIRSLKFSKGRESSVSLKRNLFGNTQNLNVRNIDVKVNQSYSKHIFEATTITEFSLPDITKTQICANETNSSEGRGSPDMFEETNMSSASENTRDDLDILASLVGKSENSYKSNTQENMSPSPYIEMSRSSSLSMKRKASTHDDFDDEDVSLSKRRCSDKGVVIKSPTDLPEHNVCDLTQSSNSEQLEDEGFTTEKHVQNINAGITYLSDEENMCDLTQGCSLDNPVDNRRKSSTETSKESTTHENVSPNSSIVISQCNLESSKSKASSSKRFSLHAPSQNSSQKDSLKENICDLTQSSCNSNDQLLENTGSSIEGHKQILSPININLSDNEENMCDLTQKNVLLNNSQKLESSFSNRSEMVECNQSQDYIPAVWDGFDDDFHYDYDFHDALNTPDKHFESPNKNQSFSKNNSGTKFSPWSSKLDCRSKSSITISPHRHSPTVSISSDSKSPKRLSQKKLHDYSPKSNCSFKSISKANNSIDVDIMENFSSEMSPKAKKNLSSHFDLSPESVTPHSSKQLTTPGRKNPSEGSSKPYLKHDSFAALQRLLDDSLNVSESVFTKADGLLDSKACEGDPNRDSDLNIPSTSEQSGTTRCIRDERRDALTTPSPKMIVSDDITPLPNYSAMKTPLFKKELSRFGLKPSLGRRKGKLLLRYIYEQTHPLVPDVEGGGEMFKQPRSPVKSPRKTEAEVNLVETDSESDETCSQRSTGSSVYSTATLPEESFCESEDILTQELSSIGDIKSSIRNLILCDPELHRKVLQYEPVYLEELMATLKRNGVKCKVNDVMDYLDEQCITFRTTSWKATNEKRRKKIKSPKKRSKKICNTDSSKSSEIPAINISPSKSQITKRRGRPRKQVHDVN